MTANRLTHSDMACENTLKKFLVLLINPSGNSTLQFFVDEILRVELKELPPISEYAFWRASTKLPSLLLKGWIVEENPLSVKVLKSHKRALAWKLSDIQGINPEFCTHKILMEEDYAPAVQHQRRVNPKIHDVIKKEVEKLLEAGLIYLSPTVPGFSDTLCTKEGREMMW
ncbi:hypothetical protein Tco_0775087 [Tanacetum coccineum]